jgi:Biotin-requiring enzyme
MDDLDPAQVDSLEDLAACLRRVHLRADRPAYRALEQWTIHANGLLPGTSLKRARLGRTTLSDVLLARKFPGKAFMLTFVDACGIDLENDQRWEQAWDRLAERYLNQGALAEAEQLRQQLAAALAALAEADQARQHAENATQQEREKARSEIERIQAELITRTAEFEQARTEATQALEAERAQVAAIQPTAELERARTEGDTVTKADQVRDPAWWLLERFLEADRLQLEAAERPERMPPSTHTAERAERPAEVPVHVSEQSTAGLISIGRPGRDDTITQWLKNEGERVETAEPLFEFQNLGIIHTVPSPAAGILRSIAVAEKGAVSLGAQVAIIETGPTGHSARAR